MCFSIILLWSGTIIAAIVFAKTVQKSEMTKKNRIFLCISECSLSYPKIVQIEDITK